VSLEDAKVSLEVWPGLFFLTCDAERLKKLKRSTTYLLRHWGPVMNAALIITLTFFDD